MNYLVIRRILEGWSRHDRDRFLHLVKFYVWNNPYLNTILIRLLGDVSQTIRSDVSCLFAMTKPVGGTLVEK